MSRLLGTFSFSLTGQSGVLTITIFLSQAIRLFIIQNRLIRSIKYRQLLILVPDHLLKHINFRLPFSIVAASPWIGLFSKLGGLLLSISVSARLKYLVLLIITQIVPLIWVIVAVFGGKCDTLVTTNIFGAWCRDAFFFLSSVINCFTKSLYNVIHPPKYWRRISYDMMQVLTASRLVVFMPSLRYLNLGLW